LCAGWKKGFTRSAAEKDFKITSGPLRLIHPSFFQIYLCAVKGWQVNQIRFYTGIPDKEDNPFWTHLTGRGE
jgi:hypothetical protein